MKDAGQPNCLLRRIDADATIAPGQRRNVPASATPDIHNNRLGRRRKNFGHQPAEDPPPPDKPPVPVLDVGVELELLVLHGGEWRISRMERTAEIPSF
jgi:hypothetical protein